MTCARCAEHTTRYTLSQRYCKPCEREVAAALRRPERPHRFPDRDLSGWLRLPLVMA